jgi:salicylate hydroxylase
MVPNAGRRLKVLVAGAGIGGLTAALALIRFGFEVEVHEQAQALGEVGAGLQVSANGTRILFALGLEPAIRAVAAEPEGKQVRLWNTGQSWKLFDLGAESVARYGAPYLMLHRADLHRVLVQALERARPGTIHLGAKLTGYDEHADGVRLRFADGRSAEGDVLVGADGVHSAVRAQRLGTDAPVFTGCMAWRGLVSADRLGGALMRPVGTNWIGVGAHVVTYPVRRGELLNFVGIVERDDWREESWTREGSREECARDFAGWHDDVQAIIANLDKPFKWALMGRAPRAGWSSARVTLLGDAAHPTLPFLAQGAVMAIEDGFVLARALDGHRGDPAAALARYEALRIERTTRIVQGSADNARRFHNPTLGDAEGAQRYVDTEWAPERVDARYRWLFEYDALTLPV